MLVDLLLDPFGARWSDLRDAARVAVDAGFRGIWTYDHLDGRVYDAAHVLECWTLLTALAAAVPSVVVGPMVLNVANRHPAVLAAMAATLQEVSGGRLLLGLGAGAHAGSAYAASRRRSGDPCSAPPSAASRSSGAWPSCIGPGAHRGSCIPIPNLRSSSPPPVRRWPRSPGGWGTASTHERPIHNCGTWSRPRGERAAILDASSSPSSRTSTRAGCRLTTPDAGSSTSSAPIASSSR